MSGTGEPRFGAPHHHHDRTDSTNLRARELAEAGAASGTVVTAAEQSSGRGRAGRVWSAPAGAALLYSAILRPLDLSHLMLPLAVPIGVCEACESVAPVECMLKWPNDVWLDERKLAGVLIEARAPDWAVIGVGVNLSIAPESFPPDLRWPATSLGHGISPETMRPALDAALGRWVAAEPELVHAEFSRRDALRGREIDWEGGPAGDGRSGTGEGIDERGNLLVRGAGGELSALGSGEVSLRVR
ncbi:MAG: biotin--[acetyl-CoA-carboxylase] ligase [Solirubrobacterales bacterium]|nr:biotin--[acetyl-CoA-carboxylase] ligase [Solirubrobacterales bacterium]